MPWKDTVPQDASRQHPSLRLSSPFIGGTIAPSSETDTPWASAGKSSAERIGVRFCLIPELLFG